MKKGPEVKFGAPLVWRIGEERGIGPMLFEAEADASRGVYDADWILLSRDREWLESPEVWEASVELDEEERASFEHVRIWTDDYVNLFQLLIR